MNPRLPVVIPTVQFLLLDATNDPHCLGIIIHSFHAASLITLALGGWGAGGEVEGEDNLELHFPSLEHLILLDITKDLPDLDAFARRFPDISRLTCQVANSTQHYDDIDDILSHVCFDPQHERDRWSKLRVLAISATYIPFNAVAICNTASVFQESMINKLICHGKTQRSGGGGGLQSRLADAVHTMLLKAKSTNIHTKPRLVRGADGAQPAYMVYTQKPYLVNIESAFPSPHQIKNH
ncbi:hypothetical protein FIBSPDRAFT_941602 [Athelia psychrophila]|uniref:Uncharacterized protein n=1 Tax=Athelia psychrophila TaxID=1759441 RepID=A0A167TTN8_9AGAM|nr:hypothetical protein FIBSPDRAFT_941602 [Fibularhizoctonia sp. CBS 109695]